MNNLSFTTVCLEDGVLRWREKSWPCCHPGTQAGESHKSETRLGHNIKTVAVTRLHHSEVPDSCSTAGDHTEVPCPQEGMVKAGEASESARLESWTNLGCMWPWRYLNANTQPQSGLGQGNTGLWTQETAKDGNFGLVTLHRKGTLKSNYGEKRKSINCAAAHTKKDRWTGQNRSVSGVLPQVIQAGGLSLL